MNKMESLLKTHKENAEKALSLIDELREINPERADYYLLRLIAIDVQLVDNLIQS